MTARLFSPTNCSKEILPVWENGGNGEGSIYQRKEDNKWVGSITLGNHKRKVFYGKTRKEVQEKMKVALHEQQQGTLVKRLCVKCFEAPSQGR